MKTHFFIKILILITYFKRFIFKRIHNDKTVEKLINENINIPKIQNSKSEFELNLNHPNETINIINYVSTKKFLNSNTTNLTIENRASNLLNLTNIFVDLKSSDDISNITKRFSCFYFNEEDFSVYDMSQLDKKEYIFNNILCKNFIENN